MELTLRLFVCSGTSDLSLSYSQAYHLTYGVSRSHQHVCNLTMGDETSPALPIPNLRLFQPILLRSGIVKNADLSCARLYYYRRPGLRI